MATSGDEVEWRRGTGVGFVVMDVGRGRGRNTVLGSNFVDFQVGLWNLMNSKDFDFCLNFQVNICGEIGF